MTNICNEISLGPTQVSSLTRMTPDTSNAFDFSKQERDNKLMKLLGLHGPLQIDNLNDFVSQWMKQYEKDEKKN